MFGGGDGVGQSDREKKKEEKKKKEEEKKKLEEAALAAKAAAAALAGVDRCRGVFISFTINDLHFSHSFSP